MHSVPERPSFPTPLYRHATALGAPVLVAVAYYLGAQAAFAIGTLSDRIFAPFWPPNVVLFVTLLLVPGRRWWIYVAATFPAHVVAELGVGMPAPQLLVAFASNCMVATLSAFAMRRVLVGPPWLGSIRSALIYILITAGISPALSAFGGAFVRILGGGAANDYWSFWWEWYVANALGSITLGPVALAWLTEAPQWLAPARRRASLEPVLLGIALVAVCAGTLALGAGVASGEFLPSLICVPLPFILWASIRFGEKGASGAILVVTGDVNLVHPQRPEPVRRRHPRAKCSGSAALPHRRFDSGDLARCGKR